MEDQGYRRTLRALRLQAETGTVDGSRADIESAAHRGAAKRVELEARALGLTREQVRRLRRAALGGM